MNNYDDMILNMQADLNRKHERKQQEIENERLAAKARIDRGRQFLEDTVMPKLLDAKSAFERNGMDAKIEDNWSKGSLYSAPQIKFQVVGPVPNHFGGGMSEASGDRAVFIHDGEDFKVSVSCRHSFKDKVNFDANEPGVVEAAITKAIESYFTAAAPIDYS